MKQITKKELKSIIKEETQRALDEQGAEKVVDEAFGLGTGTTPAQRAGFGKPAGPGGVGPVSHDPEQVAITDKEKAQIAAALDSAGIGNLKSKLGAALSSLVPTSGQLEEISQFARGKAFDPDDPTTKGGGFEQTDDKAEMLRSLLIIADEDIERAQLYLDHVGLGEMWGPLHKMLSIMRKQSGGSATF